MLSKTILYGTLAREKLQAGVDKLANAVKVTLGAKGRNVVISQNYREPYATKDGVTVADHIWLKDEIENVGAQMLRGAARKTALEAGDGTTTATVIAQAIVTAGLQQITLDANPTELKAGIEKAVEEVVAKITELSRPITNDDEIWQVANIAANNDAEIGTLVASAIKQVGRDGLITINPTNQNKTTISIATGMQLNRGFISGFFINNPAKQVCEFQDAYVLISEKKIAHVKEVMPILEQVARTGKPLVIFADSYDASVQSTLCANNVQQKMRLCAIHLPGDGEQRKEYLLDLAAVTGSVILSPERQTFKLSDARLEHLGQVDKIVVDKDSTLIVGSEQSKPQTDLRVAELKTQLEEATASPLGAGRGLAQRIASLTGGVAVINVGGTTDIEIRERKDRVDDAIRATQSALQEGIVAGGGICLMRIHHMLNHDSTLGYAVLINALLTPFEQIMDNAGLDAQNIGARILSPAGGGGRRPGEEETELGYDVLSDKYGDMFAMGIIDAAKVVRCAVQNAASVAIMIIMSECLLVEDTAREIV